MTFRISRSLLALAILFAAPQGIHAQQPLAVDGYGGDAGPWILTAKQHIAMDTFFGAFLGSMAGGLVGFLANEATCPPPNKGLFNCERPTVLPEIGFSLGVGPGGYVSARGAAITQGCDPASARRHASRGALRGTVVGLAPLLAFHLLGGRDERVEWTLALTGSVYQVASITHATWGCLDAR